MRHPKRTARRAANQVEHRVIEVFGAAQALRSVKSPGLTLKIAACELESIAKRLRREAGGRGGRNL